MGTGGKARQGRDADHSPSSSAEVKNEYELYLLSPQVPPWRLAGQLFLLFNDLVNHHYICIFLSISLEVRRRNYIHRKDVLK
jgi:hypothetical protein